MSDTTYADQSTVVHHDPNWIRGQQPAPYLHRNNILFYFMTSPFFDPSSRNSEVMQATQDFAHWQSVVGTVDNFHREMALRPGLEFILFHDPETSNTMIQPARDSGAPEGQLIRSTLFIIRKQRRLEDLKTTVPMGMYWCLNDRVFQAPSVGNVLNARVLGMGAGLGSVLERLSVLSVRAATQEAKKTKEKDTLAGSMGGLSKGETPVPSAQQDTLEAEKSRSTVGAEADTKDDDYQSFNTLAEALKMTLRYGKEYADEMTLVGEPGNFRFSKSKEPLGGTSSAAGLQPTTAHQQSTSSRAGTPAQLRAGSMGGGGAGGRQVSASFGGDNVKSS